MNRMATMVATLAVALVLGAGAAPSAGAKPIVERGGPEKNTTSALDLMRHPDDAKYYTESWLTLLRTPEGHIIYVTFLYSNIGVFSGRAGVDVSLTMPGKESQHLEVQLSQGDYQENFGNGVVEIGRNKLQVKDGVMTLRVDDAKFRLNIKAKIWSPGVKFHSGRVWMKDDKSHYMDIFYHVPRAEFEGEMLVGSQRTMLKGDLYMDHLTQNKLNTDVTDRWWTMRYQGPDYNVEFFTFRMNKDNGGQRVTRAIVTDKTRVIEMTDDVELKTSGRKKDPKGHSYDTVFTFTIKGKEVTVQGTATGRRVHDRDAMMERLGWAERGIAEMVAGNPIVYRQEGEADMTLTPIGGDPITLKGPAQLESIVNEDDKEAK